jgi:hypothetical protein
MVKDVSNLRPVISAAEAATFLYVCEKACTVDVLGAVYAGGGRRAVPVDAMLYLFIAQCGDEDGSNLFPLPMNNSLARSFENL